MSGKGIPQPGRRKIYDPKENPVPAEPIRILPEEPKPKTKPVPVEPVTVPEQEPVMP